MKVTDRVDRGKVSDERASVALISPGFLLEVLLGAGFLTLGLLEEGAIPFALGVVLVAHFLSRGPEEGLVLLALVLSGIALPAALLVQGVLPAHLGASLVGLGTLALVDKVRRGRGKGGT